MRTPRIVDAMNYIDDDLVSWAVEYQRVSLSNRLFCKPFLKACAYILVITLVFGVAFFWSEDGNEVNSPFILTAYAVSPDGGSSTTNIIEEGKKVPISRFETQTGLMGFVFSITKTDDTQPSSISIISTEYYDKQIDEVVGIAIDPKQNYYFYIPEKDEVEPFTLSLFLPDEKTNFMFQYRITIVQMDGSYYAELLEESIIERITK